MDIRNSFLLTTGLFAGLASLEAQTVKKPNVILIMTDQQRGDCIGATNPVVKTPNLDALAREGVCFDNGYSTTPSSTPARAALLTGMSPWHHGMLGYGKVARKYKFEMPRMLRNAGYYTFGIGKMHWFPQKALHGFHGTLVDESGRIEQDGFVSDYRDWFKLQAPGKNPDELGIGWNDHASGVFPLEERLHPTAWTGETAVEFIHHYKDDKPLFLKVSFARPHSPYDPPQRYLDMYKDAPVPEPVIGEWAASFANYPKSKDAAFGDYGVEHAVESRRHYYANITFIDDQIGQIIRALKEEGLYDNSVIIFVSDHGDMLGDHYHWRKTYPYEGSSHVPFLLRLPEQMKMAVKPGAHLDYPVELRDILPTFLDAAGVEVPEGMDGASMLPLVQSEKPQWREYIDLEHATCYSANNYWCALTDGKMKYVWGFHDGKEQLFDMTKDPGEKVNLAGNKKYRKALELWRGRMVAHLSERGEEYVKDGQLQVLKKTRLYSPNYPEGESENRNLKYWLEEAKFD